MANVRLGKLLLGNLTKEVETCLRITLRPKGMKIC